MSSTSRGAQGLSTSVQVPSYEAQLLTSWSSADWMQHGTWMKEKVAAPVETFPESWEVSAAVCASRAAPNWKASPPLVPCSPEALHSPVKSLHKVIWRSPPGADDNVTTGPRPLGCMTARTTVCLASGIIFYSALSARC